MLLQQLTLLLDASKDVPSSHPGILLVSKLCAAAAGHPVPTHGKVTAGLCVPRNGMHCNASKPSAIF